MTPKKKLFMIPVMIGILLFTSIFVNADSFDITTVPNVTGKILYTQPAGQASGVTYTSIIRLEHNGQYNGRLLATFFDPWNPNGNGIYQSDDDGHTWTGPISYVKETQKPDYVLWEPRLYELPQACGNLPAGTILCATRTFGKPGTWNFGCEIKIYYSTDRGLTWNYRNSVAYSEPFGTYEPHLAVASNGSLVCYYADETTCSEGDQVIGHKVSTDGGLTWGPFVTDVAVAGKRPGMPTVVKLPNGSYAMSFEVVRDGASKVYVKTSSNGLNWGNPANLGNPVQTPSGAYAGACPYMTWIPAGGGNGQLVVSSTFAVNTPLTDRQLFVNNNLGSGSWHMITAPVQWQGGVEGQGLGYVQAMIPTKEGHGVLQFSASFLSTNRNEIRYGKASVYNPTNVINGGTYYLTNQYSSLNLDNAFAAYQNGNTVWQWPQNRDGAQMWHFLHAANVEGIDYYYILNVAGSGTGAFQWGALDVLYGQTGNGAQVCLWQINGSTSQQWQVVPQIDGTVLLKNRHSGKVVDMSVSDSIMTSAKQWDQLGTPTQKWYLTPVISSGEQFTIQNVHAPLVIDVKDYSTENGGQMHLWVYSGTKNQQWTAYTLPNGMTQLISLHSGKALDTSGSTSLYTIPTQWEWSTANANQYWRIYPTMGTNGPVQWRIVPYNDPNVVLENANYGTSSPSTVWFNSYNQTSNQHWIFMNVSR